MPSGLNPMPGPLGQDFYFKNYLVIHFAQVERIEASKSSDYSPGYPFPAFAGTSFLVGMTTVDSSMMNRGYVIPAKAGNQCHIFEITTFKLNLNKLDKQKRLL